MTADLLAQLTVHVSVEGRLRWLRGKPCADDPYRPEIANHPENNLTSDLPAPSVFMGVVHRRNRAYLRTARKVNFLGIAPGSQAPASIPY